MNNIREHVLGDRVDLWNVVELSHETLPQEPIRTSGSYFWVATIGTIGGFALGIGLYLTTFLATQWLGCWPAVALSRRCCDRVLARRRLAIHENGNRGFQRNAIPRVPAPKRPDVRNVLRQPCRAIVR